MKTLFLFVFITLISSAIDAWKILGVFPIAGTSHYILNMKLMKGLVEAGHDVTMVSPYALKDLPKNGTYTDIVLDEFSKQYEQTLNQLQFDQGTGTISTFVRLFLVANNFFYNTNQTLHHPKMKKLLDSNETFDAVIVEQVFDDALKVYAHIYQCPLIILNSFGANYWATATVGSPLPVSYAPNIFFPDLINDLSLVNRAKNLFFNMVDYFLINWYILPNNQKILHAVYPDAPSIYDLYTNVSLVLLNSHPSLSVPLPSVPNMVDIGGYFIDPPKPLPKDLREFMDNASDGVIYFSMGTNLKSKNMPIQKKQIFLNVFGRLKQKIIWKFEDEELPGKPSNVLIKKWCPQQDILAHPNVLLFITHGGLLSTMETIYHGVPILALPMFADQPFNAAKAEASGYALSLSFKSNLTEERLEYLINELLNNPKYAQTALQKSKLYHDRLMKPMDTAVYWIDYVIRHRGAPHLRVAGTRLPWYKYFMIDVLGSVVFVVSLCLYSAVIVTKFLINSCNRFFVRTFNKEKLN